MSSEDPQDDLAELLAQRRDANPRRTPGREPLGASTTRKLLALTAVAIVVPTLVLLALLLLG